MITMFGLWLWLIKLTNNFYQIQPGKRSIMAPALVFVISDSPYISLSMCSAFFQYILPFASTKIQIQDTLFDGESALNLIILASRCYSLC